MKCLQGKDMKINCLDYGTFGRCDNMNRRKKLFGISYKSLCPIGRTSNLHEDCVDRVPFARPNILKLELPHIVSKSEMNLYIHNENERK